MPFRLTILLIMLAFAGCKSKQSAGVKNLSDEDHFKFNMYFVEAKRFQLIRENDKAKANFEAALKIDNTCATCYYEMAVMADEAGNVSDALRYLKKALKYDAQNKWMVLFYAELTREQRMYEESIIAYQKLVEIEPNQIQHYYDLAQVYIESKNYQKAIDTYNGAQEKSGIKPETSLQKHALYGRLGKETEAIEELNKLIEAYPNESKFLINLADYYHYLHRDEEAVKLYENAVSKNKCLYQAQLSLYEYYRGQNNRDKSFEHLGAAFACTEMNIDSKVEILLKYYSISKNDEELSAKVYTLLDIVNKTHPKDAKAITLLGDYYYRDDLYEKARTEYKKALEFEKDMYIIWKQVLEVNAQMKDYQNMFDEADKALELFPMQAELYWYKGVAAMQLKKNDEAIQALQTGVDMVNNNNALKAEFYSYLGDLHNTKKEYDALMKIVFECSALTPGE